MIKTIERKCIECGAVKMMVPSEAKLRKRCRKCHLDAIKKASFNSVMTQKIAREEKIIKRPRRER